MTAVGRSSYTVYDFGGQGFEVSVSKAYVKGLLTLFLRRTIISRMHFEYYLITHAGRPPLSSLLLPPFFVAVRIAE